MKNKHSIESAIARIERSGGAVAKTTEVIEHNTPGLRVLGTIDFLVNHHGFSWRKTRSTTPR